MSVNRFSNIKLVKIAKKHPVAFWLAIALHVGLAFGLIFANVQSWEMPKQASKPSQKIIPKAVTIDLTEIKKEKQRLVDIRQKREKKLADLKRAEKRLENERYKEQQRLKKLKTNIKKEKQAKITAENKRKVAEQKTKEAEKRKKLADKKAKKAENLKKLADKKTKEAEKRKKLADKKAKEAEKRKKLADKKAKKAEQEKQKIEQLRVLEASKFEKEQDTRSLKKEIQAEEDQEREVAQEDILNELTLNYTNQIASRVKDQWRYQGAKDGWGCDVYILQDLNGKVQSVNLKSCNIDNGAKETAFKDSIERAVYKASPLPAAPDRSIFDREILFHFKVNQ